MAPSKCGTPRRCATLPWHKATAGIVSAEKMGGKDINIFGAHWRPVVRILVELLVGYFPTK